MKIIRHRAAPGAAAPAVTGTETTTATAHADGDRADASNSHECAPPASRDPTRRSHASEDATHHSGRDTHGESPGRPASLGGTTLPDRDRTPAPAMTGYHREFGDRAWSSRRGQEGAHRRAHRLGRRALRAARSLPAASGSSPAAPCPRSTSWSRRSSSPASSPWATWAARATSRSSSSRWSWSAASGSAARSSATAASSSARAASQRCAGLIWWTAKIQFLGALVTGRAHGRHRPLQPRPPARRGSGRRVGTAFSTFQNVPNGVLSVLRRWREASIITLVIGLAFTVGIAVELALGGGVAGVFAVGAILSIVATVWTTWIASALPALGRTACRSRAPDLHRPMIGYAATIWAGYPPDPRGVAAFRVLLLGAILVGQRDRVLLRRVRGGGRALVGHRVAVGCRRADRCLAARLRRGGSDHVRVLASTTHRRARLAPAQRVRHRLRPRGHSRGLRLRLRAHGRAAADHAPRLPA